MSTLVSFVSHGEGEICIPEIVLEELTRDYLRKNRNAISSFMRLATDLDISIYGPDNESVNDIDVFIEIYKVSLKERIDNLGISVLPVPDVSISSVLTRDLAERKPFGPDGKGFRDTLIWESILADTLTHFDEIVFITNDTDFINKSDDMSAVIELQSDLLDDLRAKGISADRVSLYQDLKTFNNQVALKYSKRVYKANEPIEGSFVEDLNPREILERYAYAAVREIDSRLSDLLGLSLFLSERIRFIKWLDGIELVEAYILSDDQIQLWIRTTIVFEAEIDINPNDYGRLEKLRDEKHLEISVVTNDEANNRFLVELIIDAVAMFVVMWNTEQGSATGFILESIEFQ